MTGAFLLPIILVSIVAMLVLAVVLVSRNYHKVPPSQVAVVSGRKQIVVREGPDGEREQTSIGFRVVRGGAFFLLPVLERVDYLSLQVIPIGLAIRKAYTKEGVPVTVEAVANVKIDSAQESLINAAERFLGKTTAEIKDLIFQTLEGHLRAILGTLTVEEINNNRQAFGQKVTDEAAVDLKRMGVGIDAIVIQTISDESGYLDSLGKRRTAEVKRDAVIGEAEATRDASIRSSKARQEGEQARLAAEQVVALSQRDLGVRQAEYQAEVSAAQSRAAQQGPLAQAQSEQDVVAAKIKVKEVEVERMTEVAVKQAALREKQLIAEVIRPAEAKRESSRIEAEGVAVARVRAAEGSRDALAIEAEGERQKIERLAAAERARLTEVAEGDRSRLLALAEGESQRTLKTGEAEAAATRARALAEADGTRAKLLAEAEGKRAALIAEAEGKKLGLLAEAEALRAKLDAEAEGLRKKSDAYKEFNQAAAMQNVLERLPEIIRSTEEPLRALGDAIGKPLSAIDRVSIIDVGGGGGGGGGVGGGAAGTGGGAGASAAVMRFANVLPAVLFGLAENARSMGVKLPGLDAMVATGDEPRAVDATAEPVDGAGARGGAGAGPVAQRVASAAQGVAAAAGPVASAASAVASAASAVAGAAAQAPRPAQPAAAAAPATGPAPSPLPASATAPRPIPGQGPAKPEPSRG